MSSSKTSLAPKREAGPHGTVPPEEVQNGPPPSVQLQHVDCFELKTLKAQKPQEVLFTIPLTSLRI